MLLGGAELDCGVDGAIDGATEDARDDELVVLLAYENEGKDSVRVKVGLPQDALTATVMTSAARECQRASFNKAAPSLTIADLRFSMDCRPQAEQLQGRPDPHDCTGMTAIL